jgi:predicted GNAT family acetyltransferase
MPISFSIGSVLSDDSGELFMNRTNQVQHQVEKQQFIIELPNEDALLLYQFDPKTRHVHFYRTYVPASARGQGLASQLVQAGLAWAEQQQYQISSSCSYVQHFLKPK